MLFLRQSTASQEVLLGPFVDDTDGKTAETGLTIANTDIKLWVEGATSEASKNSGGATHIASGRYYAVLDATDTATLGKLEINVHVSGALPVRREFMVLTAMVYDSLVLGTDTLQSDVTQFGGTNGTFSGGRAEVNTTHLAGTSQTGRDIGASVLLSPGTGTGQVNLSSGKVPATLAAADVSGNLPTNVIQISGDGTAADNAEAFFDGTGYAGTNNVIPTVTTVGTVNALANNSVTAAALASDAVTEIQNGLSTLDAAGIRTAVGLASANLDTQLGDLPTAAENATAVWGAGTRLLTAGTNIVLAKGTGVTGFNDLDAAGVRTAIGIASANLDSQLGDIPTAAENADAVWDEAIGDHDDAGSTGEALAAAGSAGDPWTTALPGAYSAGQAGFIVGTNLDSTVSSRASQASVDTIDGIVDDILVDTGTTLPAAIAALPTASVINAQCDQALADYGGLTRAEATADKEEILEAFDGIPSAVWANGVRTLTSGGGAGGEVVFIYIDRPVPLQAITAGQELTFAFFANKAATGEGGSAIETPTNITSAVFKLYVKNTLNAAVITCAPIATGHYQGSVTLPGDIVATDNLYIAVTGTVEGVAVGATVWFGVVPSQSTTINIAQGEDESESPNITAYVGETSKTRTVSCTYSDGSLMDLTGWGAKRLTIERPMVKDDVQVVENAGITIGGPSNSQFTFQPNATTLAEEDDFEWSLREASTETHIISGTLKVQYKPIKDA